MAARRCSCYFGDRLMPLPSPISNHPRAERDWVVTTVTQQNSGFDILIERLWSHLESFLRIDIGNHGILLPDADPCMRSPDTSFVVWNIPLLCFLISEPVFGKYNNNFFTWANKTRQSLQRKHNQVCANWLRTTGNNNKHSFKRGTHSAKVATWL